MKAFIWTSVFTLLFLPAFSQDQKKDVLNVIDTFFATLESQDSVTFWNLHTKDARFYIVGERNDTVRTAMRDVASITFNKKEIIKEKMRDTGVVVQVHKRIAMVWAPYDLWVNEKFSHSGVDVFTLLKTDKGWRIVSVGYTIEGK